MTLSEFAAVANTPAMYALAVLLGLLWGSFGNVCIYRWPPTDEFPNGRSVVTPPSHCFVCKTNIKWYDNVPLLSYLWLRGQCRNCKTKFSPRYLIVEFATGVLFGAAWWAAMYQPIGGEFDARLIHFGVYACFAFFVVVVTFIDLDHMLILNRMTYPGVVLFYGGSLLLGHPWWQGLIGAAVGYGVIVLVRVIYFALRQQEGMGLGDAKLLAVIGALWGWQGVLAALFGGSVIGSVIGIIAIYATGANQAPTDQPSDSPSAATTGADDQPVPDGMAMSMGNIALPFGPFLAAAAFAYTIGHQYFPPLFR